MLFLLSVCLYLCVVPCPAGGWGRAPLLMEHSREWGVSGVFSYPRHCGASAERFGLQVEVSPQINSVIGAGAVLFESATLWGCPAGRGGGGGWWDRAGAEAEGSVPVGVGVTAVPGVLGRVGAHIGPGGGAAAPPHAHGGHRQHKSLPSPSAPRWDRAPVPVLVLCPHCTHNGTACRHPRSPPAAFGATRRGARGSEGQSAAGPDYGDTPHPASPPWALHNPRARRCGWMLYKAGAERSLPPEPRARAPSRGRSGSCATAPRHERAAGPPRAPPHPAARGGCRRGGTKSRRRAWVQPSPRNPTR